MKANKTRVLVALLVALLCFSLAITAFADPEDETQAPEAEATEEPYDPYAPYDPYTPWEPEPTEAPTEAPPEPTAEAPYVQDPVVLPEDASGLLRLTPEGTMTLIDDFEYLGVDENGTLLSKQFITVQSRDGKYFYIIIDRTGDTQNVYFLNQVDLSDLKTLTNDESFGEETCTCTSHCAVGHIDTSCPVCAVNMTECAAVDAVPEPTEPAPTEATEPAGQPAEEKENKQLPVDPMLLLAVVVVIAVIVIAYLVKNKGKGKKTVPVEGFDDSEDEEYDLEDGEDR